MRFRNKFRLGTRFTLLLLLVFLIGVGLSGLALYRSARQGRCA